MKYINNKLVSMNTKNSATVFFFIKEFNKYNNKIMGQSNTVKQFPMQKINLEQTHKVVIINIGTSNTYI